MKKKVNVKTIVILSVLLVVIVLGVIGVGTIRTFMSGASGALEPSGVTAVSAADGKSATISWTAEKGSIAKVEYGTTPASLVLMAAETETTTEHKLSLSSLRSGTTYYYRIRIGEDVFDNSGVPYTFKTSGESDAVVKLPSVTVTATPSATPINSATGSAATCDTKTDYNKDGVINTMDLTVCKKNGGSLVKTTPTTTGVDCSSTNVDYNSDGVINSLDRINCLQSRN